MTAPPPTRVRASRLVLCRAGDGALHLFAPGRFMRALHAVRRPGEAWSDWADDVPLGWTTPPAVSSDDRGSVDLFATQVDAVGHTRLSTESGSWSRVALLFGVRPVGRPAVGRNADGRLELFVRGASGGIEHNWQREPGGEWVATGMRWPGLQGLDPADDPAPAVGRSADGRLALLACARAGDLHLAVQRYPNGGFGGWTPIGVRAPSGPVVVANAAGGLEAAAVTDTGELVHAVGGDDGGRLREWTVVESGLVGRPAVAVDGGGTIVLAALAADGDLRVLEQDPATGEFAAGSLGGTWTGDPAAGCDADGRVVVVAVAADGDVRSATRTGPGPTFADTASLGIAAPRS